LEQCVRRCSHHADRRNDHQHAVVTKPVAAGIHSNSPTVVSSVSLGWEFRRSVAAASSSESSGQAQAGRGFAVITITMMSLATESAAVLDLRKQNSFGLAP
jgi:hypothetical protein